jgi:hypothetical protein
MIRVLLAMLAIAALFLAPSAQATDCVDCQKQASLQTYAHYDYVPSAVVQRVVVRDVAPVYQQRVVQRVVAPVYQQQIVVQQNQAFVRERVVIQRQRESVLSRLRNRNVQRVRVVERVGY